MAVKLSIFLQFTSLIIQLVVAAGDDAEQACVTQSIPSYVHEISK